MKALYDIILPKINKEPILISLPHSGTYIPDSIAQKMNPQICKETPDTDWFLQSLYNFATELGITIIQANYSRYVIDLNRDPENIPLYNDGRSCSSLVPTKTFALEKIYLKSQSLNESSNEPTADEILIRKKKYYDPYYEEITNTLNNFLKTHKQVLFFDGHSIKRNVKSIRETDFPDMILGNQNGTTASDHIISSAIKNLSSSNYQLTHNAPFKGGNLTKHFGSLNKNIHALQLEMSQDLYMDEKTNQYLPEKADLVKKLLQKFFTKIKHDLKVAPDVSFDSNLGVKND